MTAPPVVRVAIGVTLLVAAWHARQVLLLVFAGVLLALLLRTPAAWLARRLPLPAAAWVAIVAVGFVGLVTLVFWLQGDAIAAQAAELRERWPATLDRVERELREWSWGRLLLERVPESSDFADTEGMVTQATGVLARTVGFLANAVIIVFIGLVLALAPRPYVEGVLRLVPPPRRPRAREVLDQLGGSLRWWLLGRLLSMSTIGVLTLIGLAVLGIPLALVLALIAALLSFIPNIGPIASAIPAILLGFVESARLALLATGLYLAVQFVESYILDPIIDRRMIYLPPALTVAAQLVMYLAAGLLGVALATPLVAVGVVLVRTLYVEDVLGDHASAATAR